MYYVNHNACPTLQDAEEVQMLYVLGGFSVQDMPIQTEAEYEAMIQKDWLLMGFRPETAYWNDPV